MPHGARKVQKEKQGSRRAIVKKGGRRSIHLYKHLWAATSRPTGGIPSGAGKQ